MLQDNSLIALRPGVAFWQDGEKYYLFDQTRMAGRYINRLGQKVLAQVNGKRSVAEIVEDAVAEYAGGLIPRDLVEENVRKFLGHMYDAGFVQTGDLKAQIQGYWRTLAEQNKRTIGFEYRPGLCYWEVTKGCNLKCLMCYDEAGRGRKDELSLEEGLQAIDTMKKAGTSVIVFTGGEPTSAHKKLVPWIRHAREQGILCEMFSNGTLIDKRLAAKLKDAGLSYARITMLGADAETHDRMTLVEGSFEKSLAGLRNLIDTGIKACWQSVINQYNFPQMRQMVERAIDIGCHGFRVGSLDYMGQGREYQDLAPTPEQEVAIWKFMGHAILMYADQIHLGWGADVCKEDAWRYYILKPSRLMVDETLDPELYLRYAKNSLCGVGQRSFGLTANGNITPCPALPDLAMGNIRNGDFDDVWRNGEHFQILRENILEDFDGCSSCGVRFMCGGGCRALSQYRHGHLCGKDVRRCNGFSALAETPAADVTVFFSKEELDEATTKFELTDDPDNPFKGALKEGLGPWLPDHQVLIRLMLKSTPDVVVQ